MSPALPALDRARAKAYRRLIPLVFISYVIAFIDRANVASAGSEMVKALPGFGPGGNRVVLGRRGWQWIYIFWGIPAVIMGVVVFFALTDRPHQAKWLTEEERTALENELRREREQDGAGSHHLGLDALFQNRTT